MRKFSSYGQIDTELHYYAPRRALIDRAYTQLIGEKPEKGGHYMTVWAPRQTGKSSVLLEVSKKLRHHPDFDTALITLEGSQYGMSADAVLRRFLEELSYWLQTDFSEITAWEQFPTIFTAAYLTRPLILMLDEFDALGETLINQFAGEFRKIYTARMNEADTPSAEKKYLLHGLALIGVRSVLGIENESGSPFNVQRSLHIPNLTYEEVDGMFKWYERESGQPVEQEVIERLYDETRGQPGLTCWFGELLTEGFEDYKPPKDQPIALSTFERVYAAATAILPNSNILNILSKARKEPYKEVVFELFKTGEKMLFTFDDPHLNYLYMNGVIDREILAGSDYQAKFACPFVQKRLFNYFARELFHYTGKLREPFEELSNIFTPEGLHIKNLVKRFELYLKQNRDWLLQDAPKRKDLRVYEAVYHFCFYKYLCDFFAPEQAKVYPEFPTGNGKIDLIIRYEGQQYGLELKSYTNEREYYEALDQAAKYGKEYGFDNVWLISFVEYVDDATRQKYEQDYKHKDTGVTVAPIFVETGR